MNNAIIESSFPRMAGFILGCLMGWVMGSVYLGYNLQQFNDLLDSCDYVVRKSVN